MKQLALLAMIFPGIMLFDEIKNINNPLEDVILFDVFALVLALLLAFCASKSDSQASQGQYLFMAALIILWMQK